MQNVKRFVPSWLLPLAKRAVGNFRLQKARRIGVCDYAASTHSGKTRVLFYDPRGLSFPGTQKSLQILAKHLNKNQFEVFFMYSSQLGEERKLYMENSGVTLINFSFSSIDRTFPYAIRDMQPHIFEIVRDHSIDVLVAAGSGYPEFPVANVTKLPIVYIQVFGSVNPQKNIVDYLFISPYLKNLVAPSLPGRKVESFYIQSEQPASEAAEWGRELRTKLSIPETAIVFGRIGRPDNNIFDPIGLLAFEQVVKKYPSIHYIIMAPPPAAVDLVKSKNIPHVHFLPPSGDEHDIWSFHYAIDVMAHFRKDGETQGLNINESMLASRPIISHKSTVWNAHVEYLEPSFSYVAEIDDVNGYAGFMEIFAQDTLKQKIQAMGKLAQQKAEQSFIVDNNIEKFEEILKQAVRQ
jgi:glycosyltransferase involved in cell wall biosynthesis